MSTWYWQLEHLEPRYLMSAVAPLPQIQVVSAPPTQVVAQDAPYMDIQVTVTSIQSGGGNNASVSISLYNNSTVNNIGDVNFVIYAAADEGFDDSSIPVYSFTRKENVVNDDTTPDDFTKSFAMPRDLPAGVYYLVVEATPANSPDDNSGPSYAVSDNAMAVGNNGKLKFGPNVDVGVQYDSPQTSDGVNVSIEVSSSSRSFDNFDIGPVTYSIYASTSGQLDGHEVFLKSYTRNIDSSDCFDGTWYDDFMANVTLPASLPNGEYFLIVKADPVNDVQLDPTNNVFCFYNPVMHGPDVAPQLSNVQLNGGQVTATVSTVNWGYSPEVGNVKFSFYLSASGQMDGQQTPVASCTKDVNIPDDGQTPQDLTVTFSMPSGLVAGDYYLLVQADPAGGNADTSDNVACSQYTIGQDTSIDQYPVTFPGQGPVIIRDQNPVTGQVTNIGVSLSNVQLSSGQVSATISVYNYGDAANVGQVKFSVYLSTSGQVDDQAVLVKTLVQHVNVANDGETSDDMQQNFALPAGLVAGEYYLVVQADPVGLTSPDPSANVICSQDTLTVVGTAISSQISKLQVGANGQISTTVSVYNYGDFPEVGNVNFRFYVSASGQMDDQAVPVASFTQDVNVANDGSTSDDLQFSFSLPSTLAPGTYSVLLQADPAAANADTSYDTSSTTDTLTVAQDGSVAITPIIRLGVGFGNVQVGDGPSISTTITLCNYGNVTNLGQVNFNVSLTTVVSGSDQGLQDSLLVPGLDTPVVSLLGQPISVTSFSRDVNMPNDGSTSDSFQETFSLPAGLAAGEYYLGIQASQAGGDGSNIATGMLSIPIWSNSNPSGVYLTVGQDGSVTVSPPPFLMEFEPICVIAQPVGMPVGIVRSPVLNPPLHVKDYSPVNGASPLSQPSVALNYTATNAGLTPALAADGAVGAQVNSSAPALSILAGAPIVANSPSPTATTVPLQNTLADDQSATAVSGDTVDLLASASSDNTDAGTSTFYHAGHSTLQTPAQTRA
jgi:hypothetical protein